MNPLAKLSDLIEALEFESEEFRAYYDRQIDQIVSIEGSILSAVEEGEEEELSDRPDWQMKEVETARAVVDDTGDRFINPHNDDIKEA
jgi:hypothetical protein